LLVNSAGGKKKDSICFQARSDSATAIGGLQAEVAAINAKKSFRVDAPNIIFTTLRAARLSLKQISRATYGVTAR
jgi:hypothetical protein